MEHHNSYNPNILIQIMQPRVMSTQHPDNARVPFFATSQILNGEDEIKETYYVFSHFKCDEQMWDFEGKEADIHVVRKLVSNYWDFFKANPLGDSLRLTPRIPNPEVEKEEAKLLSEILEIIPRSYDYFRELNFDTPPIFEVILPMTRSLEEILRVHYFYKDFVAGKSRKVLRDGTKVSEWLGEFLPEEINVIPLFEDRESILNSAKIIESYTVEAEKEEIRVFLARSDPAMNYGFIPATIYAKKALYDYSQLKVKTYPILGVGSCPFRGGLSPVELSPIDEFPSVHTFTAQSAFKYDYEFSKVKKAVKRIKSSPKGKPDAVDEKHLKVVDKLRTAYRNRIRIIANFVNLFSSNIPRRRMRKLHIGLFGYARGEEVKLPRAITFCASLYSIGFPPEIIGLAEMTDKDYEVVCEVFINLDRIMENALQFFNPESLKIFGTLEKDVKRAKELFDFEINEEHMSMTTEIIRNVGSDLKDRITEAAIVRGFLG
jgi:phosphoenolpyruvate carboxylase